jgi:3-oxoacyl-[acyl-carrier-protein] synthase-3
VHSDGRFQSEKIPIRPEFSNIFESWDAPREDAGAVFRLFGNATNPCENQYHSCSTLYRTPDKAMSIVITGTGTYTPERVVSNDELAARLGTTPEWIEDRTGIKERRYVAPGEAPSDMAQKASRKALEDAGLDAADIDAIVFATLSPDVQFPGSGVYLGMKLGLEGRPAIDIRNQCSGFLYALSVAHGWLSTRLYKRVLVVGAEAHSPGLNLSEEGRNVSVLFGDGAGAVVVEPGPTSKGLLDISLGADGSHAESLWCELPGTASHPHISREDIDEGRHYPKMRGRAVFRAAVEHLERELSELFDRNGVDPVEDNLLLVPHQANKRINELVAQRLALPEDQVVHTIDNFGNTTAASLPMALDHARREGLIWDGRLVAMAAFGSGYTWGSALLRF